MRAGGSTTSVRRARTSAPPRRAPRQSKRASARPRSISRARRDRVPRGDRAAAGDRRRRGDREERGGSPRPGAPVRRRAGQGSDRGLAGAGARRQCTLGLATAQSNAAVALSNLRSAIGLVDPQVTFVIDQSWPTPPTDEPLHSRCSSTPRASSAPRSCSSTSRCGGGSQRHRRKAERRPVLSAAASTQWSPDSEEWTPEPSWTAGLTLSWQLFDGGRPPPTCASLAPTSPA